MGITLRLLTAVADRLPLFRALSVGAGVTPIVRGQACRWNLCVGGGEDQTCSTQATWSGATVGAAFRSGLVQPLLGLTFADRGEVGVLARAVGIWAHVMSDDRSEFLVTLPVHEVDHLGLQLSAAVLAVCGPLGLFDVPHHFAHPQNATRDWNG